MGAPAGGCSWLWWQLWWQMGAARTSPPAGTHPPAHPQPSLPPHTPAPRRRAFARCDFIVTPSLPCTAPAVRPASLAGGVSGAPA